MGEGLTQNIARLRHMDYFCLNSMSRSTQELPYTGAGAAGETAALQRGRIEHDRYGQTQRLLNFGDNH